MSQATKDNNGPYILLLGAFIGLSALYAEFIADVLHTELSLGFVVLIIWPSILIGPVLFLAGIVKSLLYFDTMPASRKLFFTLTLIFSVVLLIIGIKLNGHRNRPSPTTVQQNYCSELYGKETTEAGVDNYYSCLNEGSSPDSSSTDLRVQPLN